MKARTRVQGERLMNDVAAAALVVFTVALVVITRSYLVWMDKKERERQQFKIEEYREEDE